MVVKAADGAGVVPEEEDAPGALARPGHVPKHKKTPAPKPPAPASQFHPVPRVKIKDDPSRVARRTRGFGQPALDVVPETSAWYVTEAGVEDYEARVAAVGFTQASSFIQERDTFAGIPAVLTNARLNALEIKDPVIRAAALELVDRLGDQPTTVQSEIMALLQGETAAMGHDPYEPGRGWRGGVEETTGEAGLEALGGIGGLDVTESGELVIEEEGAAGQQLYITLKTMFPQLDLKMEAEASLLDDTLISVSNFYQKKLLDSAGLEKIITTMETVNEEGIHSVGDYYRAFKGVVIGLGGLAGGVAVDIGGDIAETVLNDEQYAAVEAVGAEMEAMAGDAMRGYRGADGHYYHGILSIGLDPDGPEFEDQLEDRMLLAGLFAPAASKVTNVVGRSVKFSRSVAGGLPEIAAAQAAIRMTKYQKRTGLLGAAAEVIRAPLREGQRLLDDAILHSSLVRKGPEEFFVGAINGRPGRRLLNELDNARAAHPDNPEGQLGYVQEVYGTQIPVDLIGKMLAKGNRDDAIATFVTHVTTPGRPMTVLKSQEIIAGIRGRIDAIHNRRDQTISQSQAPRVYHVTPRGNRESIEAGGLVAGEEGAFFSGRENTIGADGDMDVWEVDPAAVRLESDPGSAVGQDFVSRQDIPASALRRVTDLDTEGRPATASDRVPPKVIPGRTTTTMPDKDGTIGEPGPATGDAEGFVYHIGPPDAFDSISQTGVIPGLGAGADPALARIAPPHMRQPRSFWADSQERAVELATDHPNYVVFRTKAENVGDVTQEGSFSGSQFGNSTVEPSKLEYLGDDGQWHPAERPDPNTPAQQLADMRELAALRLEEADHTWRMENTFTGMPMIRYPKRNMFRAIVRQPGTSLERAAALVLRKTGFGPGGVLDVAKTVNELATRPRMFVPGRRNNPIDWREQNADIISNYLRTAGVPPKLIQQRLGEMAGIESPQQFFEFVERRMFGANGDIDNALPRNLDPELREQLITLHDTVLESRTMSTVQRTRVVDGIAEIRTDKVLARQLSDGTQVALPSRDTEYLNELQLPDVNRLIEAHSVQHKLNRRLGEGRFGEANVSQAWQVPQFVSHLATLTLKPLVMLVRIPAMGVRIQMEQALRMQGFGYKPWKGFPDGIQLLPGGIPIPFGDGRLLEGLFGEDGWNLLGPDPSVGRLDRTAGPTDLGGFMEEATESRPIERYPEGTSELRTGRKTIRHRHTEAGRYELEAANASRIDREFSRLGLDRDRILEWLRTNEWAVDFMDSQHRAMIGRSTLTRNGDVEAGIEKWVDNRIEYLDMLTGGGDPDLLNYIVSGKLRKRGDEVGDIPPKDWSGRSPELLYSMHQQKLKVLQEEILRRRRLGQQLSDDPELRAELRALQGERKDAIRQMNILEDAYDNFHPKYAKGTDKIHMRAELKRRWQAAPDTIPARLQVARHIDRKADDLGVKGDIHHYAASISNTFYRKFKVLSYADAHGTRGSLFHQANQRYHSELVARGYSQADARAIAHAKAGELTKDLMYDLTARTSTQRATKDIFWFAPATQEVLYTWLVKIPSQSYWPIGAFYQWQKFGTLIEGLEQLGVVQDDPSGEMMNLPFGLKIREKIIVVPGLSRAIELLSGGRVKVPDIAFGKLSGLNLITTNVGIPGLSVQGNFALGAAAQKWGGVFKDISDVMQPYGPEASLFPQPMTFAWEAMFGEAPPWEVLSPEFAQSQWDRAQDIGRQHAFAEMSEAGNLPPRWEDYGTFDEKTGLYDLSAEDEARYKADSEAWLHEFFAMGEQYARGAAFVRLMGSTVAPMSLYTTSEEQQEWKKFWTTVVAPEGFGTQGLSDSQRDLIEGYLEENPNSVGYATYTKKYTEKQRDLPWAEELDDAFFDDFYTGEATTLTPEEFSLKVMANESRRFYDAQLNEDLRKISPTLDPWELLSNGDARNTALTTRREAWNRYLTLNPDVEALLLQQSAQWRENNNVPTISYQAERLSETIGYLKEIAPMLSGEEDVRPTELRYVQGRLAELYSKEGEFGKPTTDTEKAIAWWYEKVMSPYIEKTADLYDAIENAQSRGLGTSELYNQLRTLQNEAPPTYNGEVVPSVEEVFYGNKTDNEQMAARNSWTSRPLSWLSDFQLEKAGYVTDETQRDFLGEVAKFDEWYYGQLETLGIASSGTERDKWDAWRTSTLQGMAVEAGAEELFALNEATPVTRLATTGFGENVETWGYAVNQAASVAGGIEAAGYSIKGFSGPALELKTWLYQSIETARDQNPDLDALFDDLSLSYPMDGGGPREGVVLYEALFFGNFNEQYIPLSLATIGA